MNTKEFKDNVKDHFERNKQLYLGLGLGLGVGAGVGAAVMAEDTLFKAYKAIQKVFPSKETAYVIANELLNARILFG